MNKNAKKTVEIKSLCDKILNYKTHDISEQKLSSFINKKSKNSSKTSLEELKKTFSFFFPIKVLKN